MVHTHNMTTSKRVWDTLMTIFEASGPIGIINTQCEFFHTFAQEGENMEAHVHKLCSLQQMLHTMGELISDCDFSNTLLCNVTTKDMVDFYYGCQCRTTDPDVRHANHADLGGVLISASQLRWHGT